MHFPAGGSARDSAVAARTGLADHRLARVSTAEPGDLHRQAIGIGTVWNVHVQQGLGGGLQGSFTAQQQGIGLQQQGLLQGGNQIVS
jgi:hypothetical protein